MDRPVSIIMNLTNGSTLLCYPTIYEKHRLDNSGRYTNEKYIMTINSNCVPLREHTVFRQMAHLRIPIISEGRGR